jgi:hypothetical protein
VTNDKRRRRSAVGLGIALAAWVVVCCLLMPPAERISTHSSRRIEPGMTRGQVEAILGGPAGDYRTSPPRPPDEALRAPLPLPPGERWQGDRHSVYVTFDARDRVATVTRFYPGPMRPSWYLGLQEWVPLPD